MWTCSKCGEKHEDQYDSCWKCRHSRTGEPPPPPPPPPPPLKCLRCSTDLDWVGTKRFHEGTAEAPPLFPHVESYDVFVCPRCGRAEFFAEGVGEEFRPTVGQLAVWRLLGKATKLEAEGKAEEAQALYREAAQRDAGQGGGR